MPLIKIIIINFASLFNPNFIMLFTNISNIIFKKLESIFKKHIIIISIIRNIYFNIQLLLLYLFTKLPTNIISIFIYMLYLA